MSEALVVADSEAVVLARELAEHLGIPAERAVIDSLRPALDASAPRPATSVLGSVGILTLTEMTPEQRAQPEPLQALVAKVRPLIKPRAPSDHSDLYDEFGLPV